MIMKLIIKAVLAVAVVGEKCTRKVWDTMRELTDPINVTDPEFLMYYSEEILFSSLEADIGQEPTKYECKECIISKFAALVDIYKGNVAECKDTISAKCRALLNDVTAEFEYCERLLVAPRCSYGESEEIVKYLADDRKAIGIANITTESAFQAALLAYTNVHKPNMTDLACWPCYAANATVANRLLQPNPMADALAGRAAAQKCILQEVAPPQLSCDATLQSELHGVVYGADPAKLFKAAANSPTHGLVSLLNEVAKAPIFSPSPQRFSCYRCHEEYFMEAYGALAGTATFCGATNPTPGCINNSTLTTALTDCLNKATKLKVKDTCLVTERNEIGDATAKYDYT